jgi:mRNA interferase MazF
VNLRKGAVLLADLGPAQGTEPGKKRPVVVVQCDFLNSEPHPSTVVCPLTTQIQPGGEPLRVRVPKGQSGLAKESDALVDQVRAIDNRRFIKPLGQVDRSTVSLISACLIEILDLDRPAL